jgi:hypothetical protein
MTEPIEFLSVDDDLDWQRDDTPVGRLAGPGDIAEGNRMGAHVDVDDDDDNGGVQLVDP